MIIKNNSLPFLKKASGGISNMGLNFVFSLTIISNLHCSIILCLRSLSRSTSRNFNSLLSSATPSCNYHLNAFYVHVQGVHGCYKILWYNILRGEINSGVMLYYRKNKYIYVDRHVQNACRHVCRYAICSKCVLMGEIK